MFEFLQNFITFLGNVPTYLYNLLVGIANLIHSFFYDQTTFLFGVGIIVFIASYAVPLYLVDKVAAQKRAEYRKTVRETEEALEEARRLDNRLKDTLSTIKKNGA